MALSKRDQQLAWGVGAAVALVTGVSLLARSRSVQAAPSTSTLPIDTGIYVHPDCTDWNVTNPGKLAVTLTPVVDELVLAGERSLWDIADAMLKRVAPQCQPSSVPPRNPFEAYLIYRLNLEAILELRRRNLVTKIEAQNHWAQADGWALFFKVPESNLYDYQDV